MSENVNKAADTLDKLAQDEAGRKLLAEVAERLARLFGGTLQSAPKPTTPALQQSAPEQTEFNVILEKVGEKRIDVVKVLREITGLGLKESKTMMEDGLEYELKRREKPVVIREAATKDTALSIKAKLEAVGATVVLK